MSTLESIQLFTALNLLAVGLSHFLQPNIWIEFFEFLYKKGNVGNIFNALIAVGMGTFILSFHFVWTWPMFIVTLYGLAQFLKGLIYLTFPSIGLKSIGNANQKAQKFRWIGLVLCVFSLILIIYLVKSEI